MLQTTPQEIEHYRLALLRVLSVLFKLAGLEPGTAVIEKLPRSVKYAILRVLRQSESSARRLIKAEADTLDDVEYVPPPKREKPAAKTSGEKKSRAPRLPQFRLIDPRQFYEELYPNRRARRTRKKRRKAGSRQLLFRIAGYDGQPDYEEWSDPVPELSPDDLLTATSICRRMQALHHALSDLSAQARRMKREIAKRKVAKPGPGAVPPLRIGDPPGHRKNGTDVIDTILAECHALATGEPVPPDKELAKY